MSASAPASTRDAVLSLLLERGEEDAGTLAGRGHFRSGHAAAPALPRRQRLGLRQQQCQRPGSSQQPLVPHRRRTGPVPRWQRPLRPRPAGFDAQPSPRSDRAPAAESAGESKASQYRQSLGEASLEARLEHLARLRRDEGYVTVCSRDDDGVSWRLEEAHCSVQRIAEEFPAVCDQELLLIRRTVPDCRVERVHWRLEGGHACGFRITPLAQG